MRRVLAVTVAVGLAAMTSLAAAAPAAAKNTQLIAPLSGVQEVPGPGDPDGSGEAELDVKTKPGKKKAEICFGVRWSSIAQPTAAHIHEGAQGTDGPIVVPLFESTTAVANELGCVKTKTAVAKPIAKNPGAYYVNVHNAEFPAGAIRGQLARQG
jgi:CHRD domain